MVNDGSSFLKLLFVLIAISPDLGAFGFLEDEYRLSKDFTSQLVPDDEPVPHHHHGDGEAPCDACPRGGHCVPALQCPAHLRPNSNNPACHLPASKKLGICCTTGHGHASEADLKARSDSSLSHDVIKMAHARSQQRMAEFSGHERAILDSGHPGVTLAKTSPSYGHYMSMRAHKQEEAVALGQGALRNLFAAQELKQRQAISDEALQLGLTQAADAPFCPPPPTCNHKRSQYRTLGGECTSLSTTGWGAVNTAYERILPPNYADGTWSIRASVSGGQLPSARQIIDNVVLDIDNPSASHNLMFMQFGQFVGHDSSAAVSFTLGNSSAISCCDGEGARFLPAELQHFGCEPIPVDGRDQFYSRFGHTCMNFVRTQLAPAHDCSAGYARQMNGVTHLMDLSHIYGSTEEKLSSLREHSGGRLKMFTDFGRDLLPLTNKPDQCLINHDGSACFDSGDEHANQMISLVGLHTIFSREHNRVAQILARLNPEWPEELLFFETRRIVQAEYQHIIYNEYLPLIVGHELMQSYHLYPRADEEYGSGYSKEVNPSLTAEFAIGAFRFGHSIVDRTISIPAAAGYTHEQVSIPEVMFQPSRLRLVPFLDRMLTGLGSQPMQNVDPFVSESLTRYMFHAGQPFGVDLGSINVQRGRDHGLRCYNDYRRLMKERPITDFSQLAPKAAQRLAAVYSSPEDMDLWIGGLLEEPVPGGVVGITFANIIADQFSRSKRGDRYYYEYGPENNPGAFTKGQLSELKKVTMARLICDNSDGVELTSYQPSAFLRPDVGGNQPVPCDSPAIPRVDFSRFKMF